MEPFQVLVVDDEVDFVNTLVKRLALRHVHAYGVTSGSEALRLIDQKPLDIVVLDVKMPGMDGIQVLRELKDRYPLVEVIMLTGHASLEVAIQGMEAGAFDYLMKPINIDELLYKLQDAYKKKSIQGEKIRRMAETGSPSGRPAEG
ncbi:MAG: response regulator [Thermodesulfobacteriota bacterium]